LKRASFRLSRDIGGRGLAKKTGLVPLVKKWLWRRRMANQEKLRINNFEKKRKIKKHRCMLYPLSGADSQKVLITKMGPVRAWIEGW